MNTQVRKTNGKGSPKACPNGADCVVAREYADTLATIDGRLERLEMGFREMTKHLTRVHDESLESRKTLIESHDQVVAALRRMEGRDA